MSLLDTNTAPILSARELTRRYGNHVGCRNISLDLWPGEVLGIVGESGSGKSTLLNMLSGRLEPSSGTVCYTAADGTVLDLHSLDEAYRRRLLRTELGFVHQHPRDGLRMSVSAGANIGERLMASGARHYGRLRATAVEWLERVEIPVSRVDDTPSQYSGGMQQRLQIARNLVTMPRLVFMDEPTGGLDVSVQARLLDLLCRQGVTSLTWAVSALCLVTAMNGLNYKTPDRVRQVLFSGEVMPPKHLRAWRKALPNARFVNLYGPTEITCNCLYYVVDRDFADDEPLPLGTPFPNERVFLLDENNALVTRPGGLGEICVAGSALALGYYNDPLRTQAVFVQNPLHNAYRDPVYRTGDLARVGDDGQWYYAARRDFQIKHMGHRIELGDIEAALAALDGVDRACCVYLADRRRIAACYAGTAEKADVAAHLRKTLPAFMLPGLYLRLEQLPMNKNGKIDRAALTARLTEKGGGPVDR